MIITDWNDILKIISRFKLRRRFDVVYFICLLNWERGKAGVQQSMKDAYPEGMFLEAADV